jgi:4-hydroxy-tetrahydrodipicolinate synthase
MIHLRTDFLRGSYTPVVTPFRDGKVDYARFSELVDRQVREGSHGVVVTGTTGEPSSLTINERVELLKVAVNAAARRIPVVAATGSQSFEETAELTRQATKAHADAVLVVTPYYSKPPQAGLVKYFEEIGKQTDLPLLLYHIPGRAAVSITATTVARIAERLPNLVGVKHAANDLEFLTEVLVMLGSDFRIFCGLEALSLPMLALGAAGLMNAVGNLAPAKVARLCELVDQENLGAARSLHFQLFELNQSIFLETNPIPLKYMMARIGLLDGAEVRLPLVPLDPERGKILDGVLQRAELLTASPV